MRLELDESNTESKMTIINVIRNDQCIPWDIGGTFDKKVLVLPNVFKDINNYLKSLPSTTKEKIFSTYTKIKIVIDTVFETSSLIRELQPLVKELYDNISLIDVGNWLSFHSDIIFPTKLDDVYTVSDEKPGSREKTYLKSDYIELVSMTLSLRLMVPIWGEFINCTKRDTGTIFKEFYAFQILSYSNIANCNAMQKLKVYVIENIQEDKPIMSSIINGISSEHFPIWLLSKVVLNRLCIGDISGTSANSTLITNIWNFVNHKTNNTQGGSSFSSMVKEKEFESGDQNNEHNASRLEGYKIKTELPVGDTVMLEHFIENPYKCAIKLMPQLDLSLLESFLSTNAQLEHERLYECQVTLAKYIFKPIFPPKAVSHLNKRNVINIISVAQAVMWQRDHKILAALMSAIATDNNDRLMLSGIDSRSRIPKELVEELASFFPFNKVSVKRSKGKINNAIIDAIDELTIMFGQRDWILTIEDNLICQLQLKQKDIQNDYINRRYSCPSDIKILLAKLIIEQAKLAKGVIQI